MFIASNNQADNACTTNSVEPATVNPVTPGHNAPVEGHSMNLDLGYNLPDETQFDFDLATTDFSIDEIMRSFDFAPKNPLPQAQPTTSHPMTKSGAGFIDSTFDIGNEGNGFSQVTDRHFLPDFLFGFDFDKA